MADDNKKRAAYRALVDRVLHGAGTASKEQRALAVTTKRGPVVLHLGGLDTEEHRAMLPAYELAKRTLRAG